jgi:hypothetical protein
MSSDFRYRASLVLSVILAVTAVVLALHRSEPAPAPVISDIPAATTNEKPLTKRSKSPGYPGAVSASDQRRWLVDQLRAMGVPNKVLSRVVLDDLDWKWNQQGGALSLKTHGDPDTMAAFKMENAMSLDAEMRAALGEEGFKQWDRENMLREANSGKIELTASETEGTYDLWKKLRQLELELRRARLKGEMDDVAVSDAYDKAVSEFKQQMKALLGDERYAKSQQLDSGAPADSLRQEFAKANPSDVQFQELLKTQQQWNEQRTELDKRFHDDQSSAAYAEQIKALDATRNQEYRKVLGDSVFETLQKEQDPGYSKMRKYANIWGLDDTRIDYVYGTMKYYEKSVEDYNARARALEAEGQNVDWDAVKKNLQQFSQQTQQALQNHLGQDSFSRLQQNGVFRFDPDQLPRSPPAL